MFENICSDDFVEVVGAVVVVLGDLTGSAFEVAM